MVRRKARLQQLQTVSRPEIEMRTARLIMDQICLMPWESGTELVRNLAANFVAARTNSRSNAREQVSRIGTEFSLHAADCLLRNTSCGPLPAAMSNTYGVIYRVKKHDRRAIRET